jgi:hypothetical protein
MHAYREAREQLTKHILERFSPARSSNE